MDVVKSLLLLFLHLSQCGCSFPHIVGTMKEWHFKTVVTFTFVIHQCEALVRKVHLREVMALCTGMVG